jgi:hypothetical protein
MDMTSRLRPNSTDPTNLDAAAGGALSGLRLEGPEDNE